MDDAEAGEGGTGDDDRPADPLPSPFDQEDPLADHWAALVEDMGVTADVYREEGWSVLELHPTASAAVTDPDEVGLAVTVPKEEFETLESWTGDGRFDEYEVYRAETGRVFLLVVARDSERRRVVCVPAHYGFESVSTLADLVGSGAGFHTHVRARDDRVTFVHDDAGPFFPGGGAAPDEGAGGGDPLDSSGRNEVDGRADAGDGAARTDDGPGPDGE